MPSSSGKLTPLGREAILRSLDHLSTRSVLVVGHDGGEPFVHGTGVCIQIANRYFVATAAHHFLNPGVDSFVLLSLPRDAPPTDVAFRPMANGYRGGGADDTVDVAWLEVSPTSLPRLAKEFVPLTRLDPFVRLSDGDRVFVYGYPEEPKVSEAEDRKAVYSFKAIGYATVTLDPGTLRVTPSANPDADVFVAYPREVNEQAPEGWLSVTPPAYGMSGAGIWQINWRTGGGWSVDELKLAGLQHAWHVGAACLRATRIVHWLTLVGDEHPELRLHIEEAFPGLRGA
jgi:hypothetical protein